MGQQTRWRPSKNLQAEKATKSAVFIKLGAIQHIVLLFGFYPVRRYKKRRKIEIIQQVFVKVIAVLIFQALELFSILQRHFEQNSF